MEIVSPVQQDSPYLELHVLHVLQILSLLLELQHVLPVLDA
jgi:hypothetical protein